MILASKFQSFPLFLTTIVEPRPPFKFGALYIVNRVRWVFNAVIILWYTLTTPCFGAQTACNSHVISHSYLRASHVTSMPVHAASFFNVICAMVFLLMDVLVRYCCDGVEFLPTTQLCDIRCWWHMYGQNHWLLDNSMPQPHHVGTTSQSLPQPVTRVTAHKTLCHRLRHLIHTMFINVIFALAYPKLQHS
jgi:hypothetical protein